MKTIKTGIIATFLALVFNQSYSQIPVQWERTLQLEGYWEGPVTLNLGGQVFNLTYHMDFKTTVDGNAMTMDEGFTDPALGELKGANLIGLNAPDGLIHWFSADNFGTAHEHTGSWLTPKRFYMEHSSVQGGLPFIEMIDARLRANNQRFVVQLVATLDGDTVQILEGTLYKQSAIRQTETRPTMSEIDIHPNPSDGKFIIECTEAIDEITVTNEMGQLVYEATPKEYDHTIDLENEGIYFVRISAGKHTETKEIVVTK